MGLTKQEQETVISVFRFYGGKGVNNHMEDANVNKVSMTEKQKVKEITDRLEEGLKELFESEKYKNYLSAMSKFHNYSANNIQLIAMQRPDATFIAGYRAWQKNFERHVNKGEKGIQILAPAPYKVKEEREKIDPVTKEPMLDEDGMPVMEEVEIKIPAFRVVTVFDYAQTGGKELPGLGVNELHGNVENYLDFMEALKRVSPVPISYEKMEGDRKGYFLDLSHPIGIKVGMSEAQTAKTGVHEVAHAKLHAKESGQETEAYKDRETKEVEAESIAYTVCQHFGIDTSDYSFGYIAGWSSGKEMPELKSSLDTIRKNSSELIRGIEAQLMEIEKEKAAEQEQPETDFLSDDVMGISEMQQESEENASNREAQLLYGSKDQFGIYQLKDIEDTRDIRFMAMDYLEMKGVPVYKENYELTYAGELVEGMSLEDIYAKFNIDRPADFTGHSLSVSDVVVLHQDGENTSHYVDSVGFREMPEFIKEIALSAEVSEEKVSTMDNEMAGSEKTEDYREMMPEEVKALVKERFESQLKSSGIDDVSLYAERFDALYEQGNSHINTEKDETELAFQLADRYISIQEATDGYDYTIYDMDYLELDGGVYDNPDMTIRQALDEIVSDLKEPAHRSRLEGSIQADDELTPVDYDGLMEKAEQAEKGRLEERIKNEAHQMEKDVKITLTVAECGEFHDLGEYHEGIATVEEAAAVFHKIPPERRNGIPSIGINVHTEGTESYEDAQMDIVSGNIIDLEALEYYPEITGSQKALAVISELISKFPDAEVRGSLDKWLPADTRRSEPEKDADRAALLAAEIDQLSYEYDTYQYNDTVGDRDAQVANITEDIRSGNTEYLNDFLNAIVSDSIREGIADIFGKGAELDDSEGVQTARKAKELLDRLAEYKPLAKIEELEECNYNMIDNVLNNEKPKEEQERKSGRISVKEKLAEKKAVIERTIDKAGKQVSEKGTEKKSGREI